MKDIYKALSDYGEKPEMELVIKTKVPRNPDHVWNESKKEWGVPGLHWMDAHSMETSKGVVFVEEHLRYGHIVGSVPVDDVDNLKIIINRNFFLGNNRDMCGRMIVARVKIFRKKIEVEGVPIETFVIDYYPCEYGVSSSMEIKFRQERFEDGDIHVPKTKTYIGTNDDGRPFAMPFGKSEF